MKEFFSTIPGIVISLGAILAVVVTGLLYALGLWKKGKDAEDDRLIKILEGTVNALKVNVDDQKKEYDENIGKLTEKIDSLTIKVEHLEKENETLTKVLQGRDEQTQLFYKKAFEAIETGEKTYKTIENLNKNQEDLLAVLREHLKIKE